MLTVVPPVVPPPGLVSWWRGEPTTSAIVRTASTATTAVLHGTTAAAPSYTPDGEVGGAFAFDGTTATSRYPTRPAFSPPQLTVEAWVLSGSTSGSKNRSSEASGSPEHWTPRRCG